ncbi:MAG: Gfo/Idh/MocA family protein [Candidatus Dormibacteria bacterium]
MLSQFQSIARACDLSVPKEHHRGIGVIGAGAIVDLAHLPAYAKAGLPIVGIFDALPQRAEDVAARHDLGRVFLSVDELLSAPEVEVVDIAVVPWAQPSIARQAIAGGKHLLCQKPFAPDLATGREIAELAVDRGLKVAVNQQLRFDEGVAAARAMVREGWIGDLLTVAFDVDILTDWAGWSWLVESPRLDLWYHSIHYLDAIRSLLGDPIRVFCTGSKTPGELAEGESRTISTLIYTGQVRAVCHVHHNNHFGDAHARFRLDGTKGSIRGTLGLLYDYPRGRPDTLEVWSATLPSDGWLSYPVTTRWLPDAFVGPMKSLLAAIATNERPQTDPKDNLGTLALIEALYRSMDTGEAQVPEATSSL